MDLKTVKQLIGQVEREPGELKKGYNFFRSQLPVPSHQFLICIFLHPFILLSQKNCSSSILEVDLILSHLR